MNVEELKNNKLSFGFSKRHLNFKSPNQFYKPLG
jgi:hypothetical protein